MTERGVKVTARFIPVRLVRGGPTENPVRQEVYRIRREPYSRVGTVNFTREFCKKFKNPEISAFRKFLSSPSARSLKGVSFLQFTEDFEHLGTVAFELSQQFFGILAETRPSREKLEFFGIDSW